MKKGCPHTLGQCLCALSLWSNYKKSLNQSLAPFSNFPHLKGTVPPHHAFSHANTRQRFVNWTTLFSSCCPMSDFSSTLSLPCNGYCQPKGALWVILNDFPRHRTFFQQNSFMSPFFYMYHSLESSLDHISSVWCKMKLMWEPLTNLPEMLLKFINLYCTTLL